MDNMEILDYEGLNEIIVFLALDNVDIYEIIIPEIMMIFL